MINKSKVGRFSKGNLTSITRPRIQEDHRPLRNRVSLELHRCCCETGHRQRQNRIESHNLLHQCPDVLDFYGTEGIGLQYPRALDLAKCALLDVWVVSEE